MITGVVTPSREAVIPVMARGPLGQETEVEGIIDTGFTGFLTLPARLITNLGLSFAGTTRSALGDGSDVQMDAFEATVLWDKHELSILVLGAEGAALVGMSLLSGHRVTLDVQDGGPVIIEPLGS